MEDTDEGLSLEGDLELLSNVESEHHVASGDAGSLSEFRSLRGPIHHSGINIANPEGILAVLGGDADANKLGISSGSLPVVGLLQGPVQEHEFKVDQPEDILAVLGGDTDTNRTKEWIGEHTAVSSAESGGVVGGGESLLLSEFDRSYAVPLDTAERNASRVENRTSRTNYSRQELVDLRQSFLPVWRDLYSDDFSENNSELIRPELMDAIAAGAERQQPVILRPYQEQVAEKSLRGENDIILLPTGTGKTFVAIKLILDHIQAREIEKKKIKIVFFAPTTDLVTQQLRVILRYMSAENKPKCCKVTGDDSLSAEELKYRIQRDEFYILVVTPDIIKNYFLTSREASLSDFSLLIFDEVHHTKKKHSYNRVLNKYKKARKTGQADLPQVVGMTATVGIGKKKDLFGAREYILDMCAKFSLLSPPSQSDEIMQLINHPTEGYELVDVRKGRFSPYIKGSLMQPLEEQISARLENVFGDMGTFPEDRLSQTYEQYIVNLRTELDELPPDTENRHVQYSKVGLNYLREYYRVLIYSDLVTSETGMSYINEFKDRPDLIGEPDIADLLNGNVAYLKDLQGYDDRKYPNDKITKLTNVLGRLFERRPCSKVIIFVQIRKVAVFLAKLLCKLKRGVFNAKEYISTGNTENDTGMQAQQRLDVRKLFEGDKYNILVATSVAEEGLDIQACNMVIRYMYIKDMIAKIQSRGRARHKEGILLTFLNEKLKEQEQRNDFKETLMYTALDQISGMELSEFQQHITRLAAQDPRSDSDSDVEPHTSPEGYQVHCNLCSAYLCNLSDIKRYMRSYYLVLNPDIHEKVQLRPFKPFMFFDGIEDCMKMLCNQDKDGVKCGQQLGNVIRMNNRYFYAVWKVLKIVLHAEGGGSIPLKKYKEITEDLEIQLDDIYIEDEEELAAGSFPIEVIEAAQRRRRS